MSPFRYAPAFAAALVLSAALAAAAAPSSPDEAAVRALDDAFTRAFPACDVAAYRSILADDFRSILADGRAIGRDEFLRQAAESPGVSDFRTEEVTVRVYGDAAVVTGQVGYRRNGVQVRSRHTDVYVRRDGRWRMVSAQFTRIAAP
jgi:ketosteroid isomerase-like protein